MRVMFLNAKDDMSSFVSKVATMLLAPIILGASCFSCLIQATPVYAAVPISVEMRMDQYQDCDNGSKLAFASVMEAVHFSDRNINANHGTDCRTEYRHPDFNIKPIQSGDTLSIAMIGSALDFDTYVSDRRPSVHSPRVFPRRKDFLIGTTIKKE